MKNIGIIYPNQLFELKYLPYDPKMIDIFIIVEDPIYFQDEERKLRFNLLKLIYQRACMKYYQSYLKDNGSKVDYLEWNKRPDMLFSYIKKIYGRGNDIHLIDPVDWLLEERIANFSGGQNVIWYETPSFLLTNDELDEYVAGMKNKNGERKFFQYSFYTWHRRYANIFMQNGKPVGGKYSYDKENRESLGNNFSEFIKKKHIKIPTPKIYNHKFYDEAISYCESTFPNYYPENYQPDNIYYYPITHSDSKSHFRNFLQYKLRYFGYYQDAIDFHLDNLLSGQLFHSVISMQQNIGLIIPVWVQDEVIKFYNKQRQKADFLYDTEGFIRQLNWREYSRLLYRYAYNEIVTKNYLGNNRHTNMNWYNGTTGIEPVDVTIKYAFQYGYLHHILRLMIMCNFMNLCQIHPDDAYKWFMEFSLDSYDWVMTNNVYSMGMYADGGLTTTKPYVSSSNYVQKMASGNIFHDKFWATSWTVLYHYFIYRNYDKFKGRGKLYQSHWNKQTKKKDIIRNAEQLIKKITS